MTTPPAPIENASFSDAPNSPARGVLGSRMQLRRPGLMVWLVWFIAHWLSVVIVSATPMPQGDVRYYFRGVSGIDPNALKEYPAVGVWPLEALYGLAHSGQEQFVSAFVLMCVAVDAAFLAAILLSRAPYRYAAGLVWSVFCLVSLHVQVLRLDIIPGVVVGFAGFLLFRNPAVAAHLLAWATAMKLWPGVLAVTIVNRSKLASVWVFVGTLAVLCGIVAGVGGVGRLTSPLSYQGERGLQIESVFATPFMVAAWLNPSSYSVSYASSKSYEIFGPGVSLAASASTWALLGAVALCAYWGIRRLFGHEFSPQGSLAQALVIVLLVIVTNKVFSPQYVLWLAPLVTVAIAHMGGSRWVRILAVCTFAMAAVGSALYPYNYDQIETVPFSGAIGLMLLVLRNALVVVTTAVAFATLREATAARR